MKFYLFILLLASFTNLHAQIDWTLERDKDGIKVYTILESGHELKSFKGITITDVGIDDVYNVMLDAGNVKDWSFSIIESKLLERGDDYFVYYSEFNSPWPVDNRDFVLKAEIKEHNAESFKIIHKYVFGFKDEVDGVVRVKETNLTWTARNTNEGLELIYEGYSDPGGKIPTWLANSTVVDSPFYSLQNLVNLVKEKYDNIK